MLQVCGKPCILGSTYGGHRGALSGFLILQGTFGKCHTDKALPIGAPGCPTDRGPVHEAATEVQEQSSMRAAMDDPSGRASWSRWDHS